MIGILTSISLQEVSNLRHRNRKKYTSSIKMQITLMRYDVVDPPYIYNDCLNYGSFIHSAMHDIYCIFKKILMWRCTS